MKKEVVQWVADKLVESERLEVVDRTPENFLVVKSKDDYTFLVAVLGVRDLIKASDVESLFTGATRPQLVVNIPSSALWSGAAIDCIHAASAAFGAFGDVSRAANTKDAGSYRDKNMAFFINAMQQHTNVRSVSYIYETVYRVDRATGASLTVAVIEAYNMSAEDVRNARARFGPFDIVVKSTSYGSITSAAEAAADSIGAQALTFAGLMQRLGK